MTDLLGTGRDNTVVYRIVWPSGEVRWVRSAATLQYDSGVAVRAVGFIIDVTEAKRTELAMRNANNALQQRTQILARQNLQDPLTGIANRRYLTFIKISVVAGV